jgi:acetolactate synthase-1/2/3 large subunit
MDQETGKDAVTGDTFTGAEAVLAALKANGIKYLLANAGTDFPPVIEALVRLGAEAAPQPVTVTHESVAVGMAHGYYLSTERPLAVMVHVNVGLANTAMGIINAASDNIPIVLMSGRTPITETDRPGMRVTPIQYGQEMFDQSALVAEATKFRYEMRYGDQGGVLVNRAVGAAMSEPRGPVYLSLPREPLMEPAANRSAIKSEVPATAPHPDPEAIRLAAEWLGSAGSPLVICQRGDAAGRLSERLSGFCNRLGIPVVEPFSIRNVLASDDPVFIGHDVGPHLAEADVVLVFDSGVPWIRALHGLSPEARVIHVGTDPGFRRMPVRGYESDLAITSDPAAAVAALDLVMDASGEAIEARRQRIASLAGERRSKAQAAAESGNGSPMSAEWMSLCLSDVLGDDGVLFSELGVVPGCMDLKGPNRLFSNPHSGGLGWAMPAALGAQLADRDRLSVACLGDGSYIFANPVACHQVSEALELPILTVIKNNGMWNAVRRSVKTTYPEGRAVRENTMPLTSLQPAPDYLQVAAASRAHVERVENGEDLPGALQRAITVIREERRQALLDVRVAVSDRH